MKPEQSMGIRMNIYGRRKSGLDINLIGVKKNRIEISSLSVIKFCHGECMFDKTQTLF